MKDLKSTCLLSRRFWCDKFFWLQCKNLPTGYYPMKHLVKNNFGSNRPQDKGVVEIMKQYIVLSVVACSFLILTAVSLSAQQGFGRMGGKKATQDEGRGIYNPALVETISGDIVSIKDVNFNNGKITGVGMDFKTNGQTIPVYLGPHIYVDLQNFRISAGDNVEVKGVKVLLDGQEAFIAGEVRKGHEVLKLRNENGVPLWAGKGQGGRNGH